MALIGGLMYSTPYEKLTDAKHTKYYQAQAKKPQERHIFGYKIIKLDEDFTFYVGWTQRDMKKYNAKKGDYIVQCPIQPPIVIKTWAEVRSKYHVFRNTTKKE
ncbi:hypothetical protein HXA34_20130 [Salipaludibacillus agaradhaerens]|nr:hypothetical protein [Salipaludibacillus agaradhaerens]MCR6108600.1 hypothetical protein [Salipaludibacillus agaradhaerens]MCR6120629.1 hypothetical protein [Salipaludibacillus agaradhaerens]